MKIVTLMENTACRENLAAEHGLSLYIETGSHRILFDAGQTSAFADNAERLGVDLASVDMAILSHGHYDHGGGLERFLEVNQTAPVYLRRDAFGQHFNGSEKYIGLAESLRKRDRLIFTDDALELAPGITLRSGNERLRPHPFPSFGLNLREQGQSRPDPFFHEQYLIVEENGKRIVISGCSHKGILNILHWFRPDVLIGGFHFMKLDPIQDARALTDAAEALISHPTTYYTGHCTGQAQFDFLKSLMGDRLQSLNAGTEILL